MKRGEFPDIPGEDDLRAVEHAVGIGHDFWSLVDSTPGPVTYRRPCACDEYDVDPECADWCHVRSGWRCLAANSRLDRCSQRVYESTPFCHFHLSRAWEVLIYAADSRTRREMEIRRESEQKRHDLATERLLTTQDIARQQQWDAATAASQLRERVYFFLADEAVKIGRSVRPEQRVRTLGGTKAPAGVNVNGGRLLGTIPGSHHVESSLHSRFRPHRLVGEWFMHEPIAADIEHILASHELESA